MIFDWNNTCAAAESLDIQCETPVSLENHGLWVCLLSSGACAENSGAARTATAGSLIIGQAPLTLSPCGACHLLCVRITGRAAEAFAAGLPERVLFAKGESCPEAAAMLRQLHENAPSGTRAQSTLAFGLLCELSSADTSAQSLPPLIAQAVQEMQNGYAHLYGIEELSETLGVSKSHFVRVFHQTMGVSPGKYLTNLRIEGVKKLLLHREYSLEIIASLCGFSGANYLCRVFKRETGQSPAAWRAAAAAQNAPRLTDSESAIEKALYF